MSAFQMALVHVRGNAALFRAGHNHNAFGQPYHPSIIHGRECISMTGILRKKFREYLGLDWPLKVQASFMQMREHNIILKFDV